ncbi:NF038122 family metalloprotease [Afipia sp. GAS231]|uniref:NF038122 family metalloprotease n=1 Tax=Afipia sp. GAS231 TaxID=1882747 RepID=UPI00087AF11C|nr:NF038122 family metalloprotease [Afipia sp. GAS231]SDP15547.1 autotransporter passenger strand-loop-strand repeat-containing protein [Afipia sp. GAS231]
MQINVTFGASVSSAPAPFRNDVNYAVSILDAAFTNNVTVNIKVGWGEVGGKPLNAGDLGESETATAPAYDFTTIKNGLLANANSPVQTAADATLPATDVTGGDVFDIGTAEAKALGLIAANAPGNDGWVGFATDANWSYTPNVKGGPNQYYFIGTVEHEITEVLGRHSILGGTGDHYSNAYGTEDLFRYSAPGVRELVPGGPHSTGYFSIDNGVTNLGNWNNDPNSGDLGDWYSGFGPAGGGPGPGGNDSFNDFSNSGVIDALTQSDLTVMNVLGWNPSEPANIVINGETYFVASGDTVGNLVVEAGGKLVVGANGLSEGALLDGGNGTVFLGGAANDTTIDAGSTLTVNSGGTLNGVVINGGTLDLADGALTGAAPIAFHGPGGVLDIEAATAPTNVISGFVAGDTIDFIGAPVGAHPTVQLLAGNVLSIFEHNKTYLFQFDPSDDFSGQSFHVTGDGSGGTLIYLDPAVLSVTTSGSGITAGAGDLNAGHVVTLTLNANEAVNVDTSNGTPTLTLNDGGIATYTGGSGSSALTFDYAVASGENTPDLTVTSVNLNGATAQDANGHDAVLTGAVGNPAEVLQIDTTPPLQIGIDVAPSNGVAAAGSTLSVTLDFNEPVAVTGGAPTLTLNDGGSAVYDAAATLALGNADKLVFDQLVSATTHGTLALAVNGLDAHGAVIADLAGNPADVSHVAASFPGTAVNVGLPYLSEAPDHAAPSAQTQVLLAPSDFHLL